MDEDDIALDLILGSLDSLKTIIKEDQFLPQIFFAPPCSMKRYIRPCNTKYTWNILKEFSNKYSSEGGSWMTSVVNEVLAFQRFDMEDFRKYLWTKLDDGNSSTSSAGESGDETGTDNCSEKHTVPTLTSSQSETGDVQGLEVSKLEIDDVRPVNKKSSKIKKKLKAIIRFKSKRRKKKVDGHVTERTMGILAKHNHTMS
jgi:hypothetical protein